MHASIHHFLKVLSCECLEWTLSFMSPWCILATFRTDGWKERLQSRHDTCGPSFGNKMSCWNIWTKRMQRIDNYILKFEVDNNLLLSNHCQIHTEIGTCLNSQHKCHKQFSFDKLKWARHDFHQVWVKISDRNVCLDIYQWQRMKSIARIISYGQGTSVMPH